MNCQKCGAWLEANETDICWRCTRIEPSTAERVAYFDCVPDHMRRRAGYDKTFDKKYFESLPGKLQEYYIGRAKIFIKIVTGDE